MAGIKKAGGRSRKKPTNVILPDVKVDKMMYQGYNTTMMKAPDITLKQMQIFVGFMERIQPDVKAAIVKQFNAPIEYDLDFKDPSDVKVSTVGKNIFQFSLREFGQPNEYKDIRKAVEKLPQIQISFPIKSKDGSTYTKLTTLCDVIFDGVKGKWNNTNFQLEFSEEVIAQLLNMQQGYTKFMFQTINFATSLYTVKIFFLISSWRDKGKFETSYKDFALNTCDGKYKFWSYVKEKVLDVAKSDLERMAKEGRTDCYFDYKGVDKNGREIVRGNPEKLIFTIYRSEKGILLENVSKQSKTQIELKDFLKNTLVLTEQQISKLIAKKGCVSDTVLLKQAKSLLKNKDIKNISSYSWTVLNDFIVKENINNQIKSNDAAQVIQPPTLPFEEEKTLDKDIIQKWQLFKQEIKKNVSEMQFNTWFPTDDTVMKPFDYDAENGVLTFLIVSRAAAETLRDLMGDIIAAALNKCFGTDLKYAFKNKN